MIVHFDDLYLNVLTGSIAERTVKSTPFSAPMSIRKLKPTAAKFRKKISQQWLSTMRYSFGFLIVGYMLKNNIERAAGFYALPDGRNLFMEFSVAQGNVITSWAVIQESPEDFLSIEGKSYDIVFGNTHISTCTIDILSLHKEFSGAVTPYHIATTVVIGVFFTIAILYFAGILKPEVKLVHQPAQQDIVVPLTTEETRTLYRLAYEDIIIQYNKIVGDLGNDKVINNITATIASNLQTQEVNGNMTVTLQSYFPFDGSNIDDTTGLYSWQQSVSVRKGRDDILGHGNVAYRDINDCVRAILDTGGVITGRYGDAWAFRGEFKDHGSFVNFVNRISGCSFSVSMLNINNEVRLLKGETYGN
jgi:hypothetical protein